MKDEEIRIVFDPSLVKDGEEYNIDFSLTEREAKYFPYLISMDDVVFTLVVEGTSTIMHLILSCSGNVVLKDAHNGEKRVVPLVDSVDITLDPHDPENSDLVPDDDGLYDLRGSILALLFNSIPNNYSEVELTRYEGDGYVLMSEEEYEREHKKNANPFSQLDDIDDEEQEAA